MKKYIVDEEERKFAIAAYKDGMKVERILNLVSFSITVFNRIIRDAIANGEIEQNRARGERKSAGGAYDENANYQAVVATYKADKTIASISESTHLATSMVKYYISVAVKRGDVVARGQGSRARRYDDEKHERIKWLYAEGKTIQEVADIEGVSANTVSLVVNPAIKSGELKKNERSYYLGKTEDAKIKLMLRLYVGGSTIAEISDKTGAGLSTVQRYIDIAIKNGTIKGRNLPRITKRQETEMLELSNGGTSTEQIAAQYNTSVRNVKAAIKRAQAASGGNNEN